jgi:glutathione synthase/RimK-type ligase-like ATP-grasp enzyme
MPRHEAFTLPQAVEDKLRTLMKRLGLDFGCIDLVLTPEGQYVFLEVNPAGQWGWIESATGMPISESIAAELVARARSFAS